MMMMLERKGKKKEVSTMGLRLVASILVSDDELHALSSRWACG